MTAITHQLNIHEEFELDYVMACKDIASRDDITVGILYLNTQPKGIPAYRKAKMLQSAIEHIQRMREKNRMEKTGLPRDYTYKELFDLLVKNNDYKRNDLKRAIKDCQKNGFYPCPSECIETIESLKDDLEKNLAKEKRKIDALKQQLEQEKWALQQLEQEKRALQQQLEQEKQANQRIRQQHEEVLKEKNHTIRQLQEDRQCPEGEWEKRYKEAEQEKEEELSKFKCLICTTAYVDVAFHPCNHVVSCEDCAKKLQKCPMCRKDKFSKTKIYTQWN